MTPRVVRIRQRFEANGLDDPSAALRAELVKLEPALRSGMRIAVGVGSRGIANLPALVRTICDFLKARGAEPFVVPAMGSHGGATAEGQREVLRLNGIAEETIGAAVKATMDAVELPGGALAHGIFMDRHAYEADGVMLINRIKPHTDYHSRYESGLMKMALIGLGKLQGATAVHDFGVQGLRTLIGPGAAQVLAAGKILAGVALVENARHETMTVCVLKANEIPDEEPKLLEVAARNMARLPVEDIDVLLIDRMGKDISGVGLDPNVTGRVGVAGQDDPPTPRVKAIVVTDLTEASHGNAIGVGLADVITQRLYDKIDVPETYRNVITSSFLDRGKIPVVAPSDRDAFDTARRSCGHIPAGSERFVRIRDTLNLEELYVSPPIAHELRGSKTVAISGEERQLFDKDGNLAAF